MSPQRQGWYWIGLGVLALGINGRVANAPAGWIDSVTAQVTKVAQNASRVTTAYVDEVRYVWYEPKAHVGRVRPEVVVTQAHAQIACANAKLARKQASIARLEAVRMRVIDREMRHITTVCPRQRIAIRIPELPPIMSDGTI